MAIEIVDLYWFIHQKWWFSIVFWYVYQRVTVFSRCQAVEDSLRRRKQIAQIARSIAWWDHGGPSICGWSLRHIQTSYSLPSQFLQNSKPNGTATQMSFCNSIRISCFCRILYKPSRNPLNSWTFLIDPKFPRAPGMRSASRRKARALTSPVEPRCVNSNIENGQL